MKRILLGVMLLLSVALAVAVAVTPAGDLANDPIPRCFPVPPGGCPD